MSDTIIPMVIEMDNTMLKLDNSTVVPSGALEIPVFEEHLCGWFVFIGHIVIKVEFAKKAA